MEPMEITIGIGAGLISPAYLERYNVTGISRQATPTGTIFCIQFETPLNTLLERLRLEATAIMSEISKQSQEILWFILNASDGWVTDGELLEEVWAGKEVGTSTLPKAVHDLNVNLRRLNFGYEITSQNGIYRLTPITR